MELLPRSKASLLKCLEKLPPEKRKPFLRMMAELYLERRRQIREESKPL